MKLAELRLEMIRQGRDQIEGELERLEVGGRSTQGHDATTIEQMLACLNASWTNGARNFTGLYDSRGRLY